MPLASLPLAFPLPSTREQEVELAAGFILGGRQDQDTLAGPKGVGLIKVLGTLEPLSLVGQTWKSLTDCPLK